MAHFAKLDENNVVLEVHVVANAALDSNNEEESGIAFLTEWSGGYPLWKQTSYNASIRNKYAAVGDIYKEDLDVFISSQPYESWIFDEQTYQWNPSIPYPKDGKLYNWNEATTSWVEWTP
jgi:hypothetical protein